MWYLVAFLAICAQSSIYVSTSSFDNTIENALNIPKFFVDYKNSRSKRSSFQYVPLRFSVDLVTEKNADKLQNVINKATTRVSELLSVIPVDGPLFIERTSCGSTWSSGPNIGRCSSIRSKNKGEFCENKIDSFKIPDKHLSHLEVYSYNESSPLHSISGGNGAHATDYILYVRSHYSESCMQADIQAYASYCRLDQNNRPIAGFINFCPSSLSKKGYNEGDLVKIAIHEIFHALGFSKDLFSFFKGCPVDDDNCSGIKKAIVKDDFGIPRLVFPTVVKVMKNHFKCYHEDFGAPLEVVNGTYTSHWDPLLLYGSIMSPHIEDLDFAFIDLITLAVFADSGWYNVNFEGADYYTWAAEGGCNFGLTKDCKGSELCAVSKEGSSVAGCDFMHYSQTRCQRLSQAHVCGVFRPNVEGDCRNSELQFGGMHFHHLRCFATEEQKNIETICTAVACPDNHASTNSVSILVNDNWVTCPFNDKVVVGRKSIVCPKMNVFCSESSHHSYAIHSGAGAIPVATYALIGFIVLACLWIIPSGMILGISLVSIQRAMSWRHH